MFYTISYDIRDDDRRNSVSKILEGYGQRVQRSVFECNLTSDQVQKLLEELEPSVNTDVDSLRCYPLCNACPGNINECGFCHNNEDCYQSGGTTFSVYFPPAPGKS